MILAAGDFRFFDERSVLKKRLPKKIRKTEIPENFLFLSTRCGSGISEKGRKGRKVEKSKRSKGWHFAVCRSVRCCCSNLRCPYSTWPHTPHGLSRCPLSAGLSRMALPSPPLRGGVGVGSAELTFSPSSLVISTSRCGPSDPTPNQLASLTFVATRHSSN